MSGAAIAIHDIAWPRLRAPDLDVMEAFLVDFGLVRAARTEDRLYMRGTGPAHHIHITEKGDPAFVSLAYHARCEEDLHRAADLPDAVSLVHAIDEPGGGRRVLLREPSNGFLLEIVHGVASVPELPVAYRAPQWDAEIMRTVGDPGRLRFGPAHVRRISHGVFSSPRPEATLDWFHRTLGFLCTDVFYIGERDNMAGGFYRLDRGAEAVDHHVLNVYRNPRAGFQHASFVVEDAEDILIGHQHLMRVGQYKHLRGVGYHPPGGQIYDYWVNPFGQMHELYLPTQFFPSHAPANIMPAPAQHNPESEFANTITEAAEIGIGD
ncbi:catechol 2,3-dioxygenase [Novosphingobium flavum]|uniref:Catechol 2,3-dioxygenase n=1 Tax=Novosphingobium flavum TaxID=1778672 RepID=A0A7X1KL67_9SPHN|nr:catechol 2,3-dioxygenase [Novosphingobium flavum]MBC2665291.1 catechol 2,3-dioxygenase [Novosphingobium flavum]